MRGGFLRSGYFVISSPISRTISPPQRASVGTSLCVLSADPQARYQRQQNECHLLRPSRQPRPRSRPTSSSTLSTTWGGTIWASATPTSTLPFSTAYLLTALSVIINTAFFFVPSGVGVFEGGHVFLFHLLGLDAGIGLAVGLLRRVRKVFWVVVGFMMIFIASRIALASPSDTPG